MALRWSARRQFLYSAVGAVVALILLVVIWQTFFTTTPTCFDNKQNGGEAGVDCGGTCALLCQNGIHEPTVVWARVFQTSPTTVTAAAYIQNSNVYSAARNVKYSFQLFDDQNVLVKEYDGTAQLSPVHIVPIIVPSITVGNRLVSRALFAFSENNVQWVKIPKELIPALTTSQQHLSDDGSRLEATLSNLSITDAKNVSVNAVLFDAQGVARAASKSLIGLLPAKSSQQVVFTWPQGSPNVVSAEITILPSF